MSSFWLPLKQQWTIKISSPLFSILSLVTILVGSRDHRTHIWKGAIQGTFHQSLVQIGPVASEELIKMWKVNGQTDNRRWTLSGDNSSHVRWAKNAESKIPDSELDISWKPTAPSFKSSSNCSSLLVISCDTGSCSGSILYIKE